MYQAWEVEGEAPLTTSKAEREALGSSIYLHVAATEVEIYYGYKFQRYPGLPSLSTAAFHMFPPTSSPNVCRVRE